jgi:hypothetical protein
MSVSRTAIFVAVVADCRAIAVAGNVGVGVVRAGFLVRRSGVAVDASKRAVVGGNLMAVIADGAVVRNRKIYMVERRSQPTAGGVAGVASGGIASGDVIGDAAAHGLRAVPVRFVAAVASGVGSGEGVIAVEMASGTGGFCWIGVNASERPTGSCVIKFSVGPVERVVAGGALRSRESRRDVIGNVAAKGLRAGPGGLMATIAIGVGGGEVVIVAGVTIGASGNSSGGCELMRTGEGPACAAVIEGGVVPRDGVVARGTIWGGKGRSSGGMRRISGLLPCCQVAAGVAAIRRCGLQVVVSIDVARGAGNIGVTIGQQKSGCAVVEGGGCPSDRVVAIRAIRGRKRCACLGMRRTVGLLPGCKVASGIAAIGRRNLQSVVVLDVAGGTSDGGVRISERESSGIVIELCTEKGVEGMAALAV